MKEIIKEIKELRLIKQEKTISLMKKKWCEYVFANRKHFSIEDELYDIIMEDTKKTIINKCDYVIETLSDDLEELINN